MFKSVAIKALVGRGWSVMTSDPDQITATLTKIREYRVSVSIKPGVLIKIDFIHGYGSARQNWLNNIRKDLESYLLTALAS